METAVSCVLTSPSMVNFSPWPLSSSTPASTPVTISSADPTSSIKMTPPSVPAPEPAVDQCPVDHDTRSRWLAANQAKGSVSHPFHPSDRPSTTGNAAGPSKTSDEVQRLSQDRVISSIPRSSRSYPSPEGSVPSEPGPSISAASTVKPSHSAASATDDPSSSSGNWVYPSESQFFHAMLRKNHNPRAADMRTIVPIHNAVNEKAWEEVLLWEAGHGGERCGGIRLVSFEGRPRERTPKAWAMGMLGYTPPFDRHDWLIDRCGKHIRYVIDFYSGKSDPNRPGNMAFHLDVRPALDDWEGVKTRVAGWWR